MFPQNHAPRSPCAAPSPLVPLGSPHFPPHAPPALCSLMRVSPCHPPPRVSPPTDPYAYDLPEDVSEGFGASLTSVLELAGARPHNGGSGGGPRCLRRGDMDTAPPPRQG